MNKIFLQKQLLSLPLVGNNFKVIVFRKLSPISTNKPHTLQTDELFHATN